MAISRNFDVSFVNCYFVSRYNFAMMINLAFVLHKSLFLGEKFKLPQQQHVRFADLFASYHRHTCSSDLHSSVK